MEFVINEIPPIKIKVGEQSFEMKQPTMAIQKALQEKLEECEKTKKSPFEPMIDWAVSLGLPRDFVLSLPQKTFQEIVEYVSDTKKK
jgi:hypothetical protein